MNDKTPRDLWHQADDEYPDDKERRGRRYAQLMREAGFIVDRLPGDDSPPFECGYDPFAAPPSVAGTE